MLTDRVLGLLPQPDYGQEHDTPELRAAALAIAQARNGFNVLARMYGTNPLFIDDPASVQVDASVVAYQQPLPLNELELPSDVKCLRLSDESATFRTVLLESKNWSGPRLLKVVRTSVCP